MSNLPGSSVIKRGEIRSRTKALQCLISVFETVENKKDNTLLQRMQRFDLFEREAYFYISCRRQYQSDLVYWQSSNDQSNRGQ